MGPADLTAQLDQAQSQLNQAADNLAGVVLDLDDGRGRCIDLADRWQSFAARNAWQHGLAGPAAELARLFRELDEALGRLSSGAEALAASGGRLSDRLAELP